MYLVSCCGAGTGLAGASGCTAGGAEDAVAVDVLGLGRGISLVFP